MTLLLTEGCQARAWLITTATEIQRRECHRNSSAYRHGCSVPELEQLASLPGLLKKGQGSLPLEQGAPPSQLTPAWASCLMGPVPT